MSLFQNTAKNTWLLENKFTPRGDKEYSEVFDGVNYQDFTINILDRGDEAWKCPVIRRLVSGVAKHKVIIPKEPTKGSYFGQCTCGLSKRDAVPCEHMAAIVASSRIGVLTRNSIMPFLVEKDAVAGAISSQCDSRMLCKHVGNLGRL